MDPGTARRAPLAALLALCGACASGAAGRGASRSATAAAHAIAHASGPSASALIEPRSGSALAGTASFVAVADGLGVHVEVHGAAPGPHGVHLHRQGNCSAADASSAGDDFDPAESHHHGGPTSPVRHAGDLGNLVVDAAGNGTLDVIVPDLSLDNLADGVVDRAIVVHAREDDLASDPEGGSGARIGCGVVLAPPLEGRG